MVYNPSIPAAGDFLSVSQVDIFRNYNTISSQYAQDHVELEFGQPDTIIVDNRGHHEKVSFVEQGSDPAVPADTYAVYTKNNSGLPEIFARPPVDGTVYRWTKAGALAPGLRLEAFVLFDRDGNILQDQQNEDLKFNVDSITIPNPLVNGKNVKDDWIVNFENNITTTNYFWYISAFYGNQSGPNSDLSKYVVTVPYMFGSYSDAIKNNQIRIITKNINSLSTVADNLVTKIIHLQVFTVP